MDLFQKVLRGEMTISDEQIITESVKSLDNNENYYMEATYSDSLQYMKTLPRKVILPKGNPIGKGSVCFIYSNNIDESIDMINNENNFKNGNHYFYYFYTPIYKGKLQTKTYRYNLTEERKGIYKRIQEKTRLHPYTKISISGSDNRNLYFDLSKYIEIFFEKCGKYAPKKKLTLFWDYIKGIINTVSEETYPIRFILIDVDSFSLGKKLQENLKNPIFMLYYSLYRYFNFIKDFDIDIYFYTNEKSLRINPSKCDENSFKLMRVEMNKLCKNKGNLEKALDETQIKKEEALEEATGDITTGLVGDITPNKPTTKSTVSTKSKKDKEKVNDKKPEEESLTTVEKEIRKKIDSIKDIIEDIDVDIDSTSSDDLKKGIETIAENEINNDKELIEKIYDETRKKTISTVPVLSERDRMLRDSQKKLKVKNMTVDDLVKMKASTVTIPKREIESNVQTPNDNMKHIQYENFDRIYNEKVMPNDIMKSVLALNNKSIPMFLRAVDVEDTSDELNYKETYTFSFEDVNRQRHTVKVDIPKFVDDKFIYIGGNKKIIKKQEFLYPVVKTSEDTVQIVTNYNKMFIRRIGTKSVSSVERLKKLIDTEDMKSYFKFGNAAVGNKRYITTIEYDEIGKIVTEFNSDNLKIWFSQTRAHEYADTNGITIPLKCIFIGIDRDNRPIFINEDTQKTVAGTNIEENKTIIDLIVNNIPDELKKVYGKIKIPKRLMYARVTVMAQNIAVMPLLCFWEGLNNVLKKVDLKYSLSDKIPTNLTSNESYIQFADCYMVYKETVGQSLLMNGLRVLDTSSWNVADMDTREPYMRYFIKSYGTATIANALLNFYEFTIDPITEEVLQDINLPTDLVELIIYAVNLLSDSQYTPEINQRLSRIRSNEIIPAILYESFAKSYVQYRNSNGKKKFSMPQDIVIKKLLEIKTVEEYSTLNPILELEMTHSVSSKGFRGVNLDKAYNVAKRSYDPSMTGVIAVGTSPDGNVGVLKTMTMEPSITSIRGYVDVKNDKLDELKDVNLFSPSELSIPLGATKDDPTRLGHAIKQSRHVIPVKDSSPVLISNGFEEVSRFHLSSDFVVNADEDGEVVEKDDSTGTMVVKYTSGKYKAVNLEEFIVKNGGGGFYLSNKLITKLNVGDKFKEGEALAYHRDFFTNDKFNNCKTNMGTLAKVAIMTSYNTYEDSTFISQRLSDAATTEMVFPTQIVIGKNSNLLYMVKKGQHIEVGDPLVQFDTSYDDSELNKLLQSLGNDEENKQLLTDNSKNNVKSKYSGVVEKIRIYSTVDLDELSPSLKKTVKSYYNQITKKTKLLEKYDPDSKKSIMKCGILCTDTTKKITPNKYGVIKGKNVEDSVLIEIFIKHSEPLEVGSKIANFTGLKNTIGEVIPEGYEPRSEFRPDEIVDSFISSNSILARMVPTIIETVLGNKMIVELKRKLQEIYES